jgi:hypothetical protein
VPKKITNIAYHLALSLWDSPYLWQAYLSAITARFHNPSVQILLSTDRFSWDLIKHQRHPILKLVEPLDLGIMDGYSLKVRSRLVKIRTASKIGDSFLLLDGDTAFMGPLPEMDFGGSCIAAADDAHVLYSDFIFPDFLIPNYKALGWNSPTDRYLNSGVIWVANASDREDFFEEWEEAYLRFIETGLEIDQGAFNHVIEQNKEKVATLGREFNAFVSCKEEARKGARILHFFSSAVAYQNSYYKKIVDGLMSGVISTPEELNDNLTKNFPFFYEDNITRCIQAGYWLGLPRLLMKKYFPF